MINIGDRVSISFKKGNSESVTLFSHWSGMQFVETANEYIQQLKNQARIKGSSMPLYRLDPETVMVDFIRHITTGNERVESNLYLGKDDCDGDNSDNGHYTIEL